MLENRNRSSAVDTYINLQPSGPKQMLCDLREMIHQAVPNVQEMINYGIPAFALVEGGKREQQVMIAGYEHHVGFYPHPATIAHFAEELTKYKTAKGSVQFPLGKPLPEELIIAMVTYRKICIETT